MISHEREIKAALRVSVGLVGAHLGIRALQSAQEVRRQRKQEQEERKLTLAKQRLHDAVSRWDFSYPSDFTYDVSDMDQSGTVRIHTHSEKGEDRPSAVIIVGDMTGQFVINGSSLFTIGLDWHGQDLPNSTSVLNDGHSPTAAGYHSAAYLLDMAAAACQSGKVVRSWYEVRPV
jgi:hypothetical protein